MRSRSRTRESKQAQKLLGRMGLWAELSSAIAFSGINHLEALEIKKGPVIFINTSSGFKDITVGKNPVQEIDGSWDALVEILHRKGIVN